MKAKQIYAQLVDGKPFTSEGIDRVNASSNDIYFYLNSKGMLSVHSPYSDLSEDYQKECLLWYAGKFTTIKFL
jgi:hypothetical protein